MSILKCNVVHAHVQGFQKIPRPSPHEAAIWPRVHFFLGCSLSILCCQPKPVPRESPCRCLCILKTDPGSGTAPTKGHCERRPRGRAGGQAAGARGQAAVGNAGDKAGLRLCTLPSVARGSSAPGKAAAQAWLPGRLPRPILRFCAPRLRHAPSLQPAEGSRAWLLPLQMGGAQTGQYGQGHGGHGT